jgi:hypothetical protein
MCLREIQLFSHWINLRCSRIVLHCDQINLHCCRIELCVGGSCCKILATQRLSNQHHICQNKLLATHELRRIKLCPDLSNSLVTESTFAIVNLTYIIIYSTTTTIGLTSTVARWTSAATNRASYDDTARSIYKVSRARINQTLPSKLALLCWQGEAIIRGEQEAASVPSTP